jgi:myo-inositol-1-phosphate synthase
MGTGYSQFRVLRNDTRKAWARHGGSKIMACLRSYFRSPVTAPGLYPEHDLFIQLMKLKNTLRHLRGEELITHPGLEYYD